MPRRLTVSTLPLSALALAIVGCGGAGGGGGTPTPAAKPTLVAEWNEVTLDAITEVKTPPPVNSRAIAIVQTAIYDAWAAYDSRAVGTRLGGSLRRPLAERTDANKQRALSYAAYRALVDLYPTQKPRFDAKMAALGYDESDASTDPTSATGVGNLAAAALLEYRHSDGSNQANGYKDTSGYVAVNTVDKVNDLNRWQPQRFVAADGTVTVPGFTTPHWGGVKTFAVTNVTSLRPGPPPQYPSAAFTAEVQEIVDLSANLTDEQKTIAEYWKDGPKSVTPPGHWCDFAQFVALRDRHTLDQDVKMFFLLGNAEMDAAICCWDAKRTYDSVRPITAVRTLFAGQQIRSWNAGRAAGATIDGKDWVPYQPLSFITPPFAEYTSGHSTFSAAGAEILRRFTGSDRFGDSVTVAAGSLTTEPGVVPGRPVTLSWATFTEAADQAGMSRRYGGIHFKDGDLVGRTMGRRVGEMVYDRGMTLINGSATTP